MNYRLVVRTSKRNELYLMDTQVLEVFIGINRSLEADVHYHTCLLPFMNDQDPGEPRMFTAMMIANPRGSESTESDRKSDIIRTMRLFDPHIRKMGTEKSYVLILTHQYGDDYKMVDLDLVYSQCESLGINPETVRAHLIGRNGAIVSLSLEEYFSDLVVS